MLLKQEKRAQRGCNYFSVPNLSAVAIQKVKWAHMY